MSESPHLEEHFQDLGKQRHAAHLGMWIFLASEVMLFSGLFALYAAYRVAYPAAFGEAARHTDLALGTAMTVILLGASFFVAWSDHAMREGRRERTMALLGVAAGLGVLFLFLKLAEWFKHFRDGIYPTPWYRFEELPGRGPEVFFTLYYMLTGLHFAHVSVGIGVLLWMIFLAWRRKVDEEYHAPLENGGMYWHLVDIIWLFLWPMFYLLRE